MGGLSKRESSQGFTLIELLVVIAIIGLVMALLIPATQQARAAARRMSCHNNLRQIGIAMHNYESAMRRLPAGYLYRAGPQGNDLGFGWAVALLPFLEQSSVYAAIRFDVPTFHDSNRAVREQRLQVMLCPEDRVSANGMVEMGTEKYAMASYVASYGPPDLDETQDKNEGLFARNSQTRFAEIIDGLSNTFALSERENGPFRLAGTHGPHFSYETTWFGAIRDIDDSSDDHGHMVLFQSGHTPNSPFSDDRDISAPHIGYANFLFADGSVRLITEAIDFDLYSWMSTRAGGEILSQIPE